MSPLNTFTIFVKIFNADLDGTPLEALRSLLRVRCHLHMRTVAMDMTLECIEVIPDHSLSCQRLAGSGYEANEIKLERVSFSSYRS